MRIKNFKVEPLIRNRAFYILLELNELSFYKNGLSINYDPLDRNANSICGFRSSREAIANLKKHFKTKLMKQWVDIMGYRRYEFFAYN